MATKDELAAQVGDESGKLTKDELQARADELEAAGPFVAEGDEGFKQVGKAVTGVQALTADDIPEAGR